MGIQHVTENVVPLIFFLDRSSFFREAEGLLSGTYPNMHPRYASYGRIRGYTNYDFDFADIFTRHREFGVCNYRRIVARVLALQARQYGRMRRRKIFIKVSKELQHNYKIIIFMWKFTYYFFF